MPTFILKLSSVDGVANRRYDERLKESQMGGYDVRVLPLEFT